MAWSSLRRPGGRWRNWSRNLTAEPDSVFYPKALEDLIAIVRRARAENRKVRVTGRSHTWAPLVPTKDFLVFTKHLKAIDVELDGDVPRITIGPGTTIDEFDAACRENDLVLPTNVPPTEFSMVAVAATGCHGTGIHEPTISDFVDAIEVVDSDGNLRRFTADDGDDVMNAARLNLGMLGIVWRMTFRVQRAFNVRELDDYKVDMEGAIPSFQEWVTGHDYTELVWWPFNRNMWVKHYDRVAATPTIGPCRHCLHRFTQEMNMRVGRLLYGVMMLLPRRTPTLVRLMYRAASKNVDAVIPVEWAIHYQAGLKYIRATNVEVAFPVSGDFRDVEKAWRVVLEKTEEYEQRGMYPFNMALVVRFVHGSPIPLSPAHGDGLMCFIEIMSFADTKHWVPYSTDVMTEWLKIPGARPHWAKEARQFPVSLMREKYGSGLDAFVEVRDRLGVDPDDMFVNDYLQAVFFDSKESR